MIQMFAAGIAPTRIPAPAACPDIKPRPAAGAKGPNADAPGCFHDVLSAVEADGRSTSDSAEPDRPPEPAAEPVGAAVRSPGREPVPDAERCEDRSAAEAQIIAAFTPTPTTQTPVAAEPVFPYPAAAEPTSADAEASGDSLLELIRQLEALQENSTKEPEGVARLAVLLQQIERQTAELPPEALPGRIHQALRDLREHLSGIAWGQAVKAAAAPSQSAAPAESAPAVDLAAGAVRGETAAAALTPGAPETPTAAAYTSARPQTSAVGAAGTTPESREHLRPMSRPIADRRPLNERSAAPAPAGPEESAEHPSQARFTPVRPADAARPSGPTASAEPVPPPEGHQSDASADTRATRNPLPALKTAAVETLAAAETDSGAGPDPLPADGRGLRLHEPRADRSADATSVGRDREPAGVNRAGVFDQIVQRAVLQVRNDQSEIKIDLKPDFLGNVRMQIVAEHQQVSVRILTDGPVVRDMIETGLQQLRSDLQSQGLQVDRIEVSVSDGYRDPRQRRGWEGEAAKGERADGIDADARTGAAERSEPSAYRPVGSARRSNVDMFV